jgi:hypothetical protein
MHLKHSTLFLFLFVLLNNTKAQTGIGTTVPVNKFDIFAVKADPATSGATANGHLRLGATSGDHVLDFGLSSSSTYSWLQARNKTGYGTYYKLALNPNGGQVGIGTASPSSTLTVGNEGGTVGGDLTLNPQAASNEGGQISIRRSLSGGTADWTIDHYGTSNSDARFRIFSGTSETSGIIIKENGKLGLGTVSPGASLHIENGNNFGTPAITSSPSIYLINNNNTSTTAHATIAARTAGTGGGKPFFSLDVTGFSGYSLGINNPTDQLIINTSWDFNTAASNNAIIITKNAQARVIIPEKGGLYPTDWPSGWGGGLSTYDFLAYGILGNAYNTRSDIRLKNTILNLDSVSISKYLQLRPVSFFWNEGQYRESKLQYGFIAQEIETLFPEMVNTGTDTMKTKSVNYQALHALSLKVIQSQQEEIGFLKKKQAEFEARLLKLEAKLNQ